MADQPLRHLFVSDVAKTRPFTSPFSGGEKPRFPDRDRGRHGEKLIRQLEKAWKDAGASSTARQAVSLPSRSGVYIEFLGAPGFDLLTKSLESRGDGIRLLNVRSLSGENGQGPSLDRALVFVPPNKEGVFLRKLRAYVAESTQTGKPKNQPLVASINDIQLAVLESFWQDDKALIPNQTSTWCEIWLSSSDPEAESRFRDLAVQLQFSCDAGSLRFPERTVVLADVKREQLISLVESSDDVAEIRLAKETAQFFMELPNRDQAEWVKDLLGRISVMSDTHVSVCVLDTGTNNKHPLLEALLADADCHSYDADWGTHDHDGHGTLMAGTAAFGDLLAQVQGTHGIEFVHCLESVKILPPQPGKNEKKLWGYVTTQAVSRAEIQAPNRQRILCMAVSAKAERDRGRPTSWSAQIDSISSGYSDDQQRLFIIAAGNINDPNEWIQYPDSNFTNAVHDPAQAWNAVTVGAYTTKTRLTDPDISGYQAVAPADGLSPFSTTSVTWEPRWPVKPDIVLEGGNVLKGPDGTASSHDDLSLLSTFYRPNQHYFGLFDATSAAAAQAACLAAQIQAAYPQAWPETVRGLLVHSAQWTDAMKRQFLTSGSKGDYARLMRICGYGVPNFARALECGSNYLTLIAQEEIQPFELIASRPRSKDMHIFEMPFPQDLLLGLGEMEVTLRVTLSYFVEPGPGEVGWKDRYRYPSHALRFDVNSPGEPLAVFEGRINPAFREEDEDSVATSAGSDRWTIGANGRKLGSIHSDMWVGTAAEISTCNLIGVYPVIGWWRERYHLGRCNRQARFSLIVSLHTPSQTIDIYTPVATKIGITIPT